jgi:betaine-aldehyde dehydrogenase
MKIDLPSATHADRFYIDGQWVTPTTDRRIEVLDSTSERCLLTVAEAVEADIDRAVAAAREAFDHGPWPRLGHRERAAYLAAMGTEVLARSGEIADAWTGEVGILRSAAQLVTRSVGKTYQHFADMAETYPFVTRHTPAAGAVGLLVREPVGVVAAIVPWNSPITMIAHKIAPALLAGCTVIVKLSPEAPSAGLIMAEICAKLGLPRGVVNVVTADRTASESLVRHPDVDKITFTGSSAAGKAIAAICGARIARCTLELGGKSAGVILDDYDLGAAARSIASTARIMTGQVCSSLTRVIVSEHRHDALVEAMAAEFAATRVGDPTEPDVEMGPLASARQRDRVEGYIAAGRAAGARLATGGGRPAHRDRGYFIEPTLFAGVANDLVVAREEIFGPVVCVLPARDERQAVEIANDTPFGLNSSVFTHDVERAWSVARALHTGTVGHNSWRTDFGIAFGGFRQSGLGREGAVAGLEPFLELKTVILDGEPAAAATP